MAIDIQSLIEEMTQAAFGAAKGQAQDLREFIESQTQAIASDVAGIESDLAANTITLDEAQFSFSQIKNALPTIGLAVSVTTKAAAQDAINAALNVAASVASKALGISFV